MLQKHPHPLRASVASALLIIVLSIGGYILVKTDFQTATTVYAPLSVLPSATASPSPTAAIDPYGGWLTYSFSDLGVSLRYPLNQEVVNEYQDYDSSNNLVWVTSKSHLILVDREENRSTRMRLPWEGHAGNYEVHITVKDDAATSFSSYEAPPADGEQYLEYTVETRQLAGKDAYFYRYVSGPAAGFEPIGGIYQAYRILLSEKLVAEVMLPYYSNGNLEDLELIAASLTILD